MILINGQFFCSSSPSIATYFPGGRLGNMLTAFTTIYWINLDFGMDVYLEREAHKFLSNIFEGRKKRSQMTP